MSAAAPVLDFSGARDHRPLHDEIVSSHPSLLGGTVLCGRCGNARKIEPAKFLRSGWPRCKCVKREKAS